MKMLEILKKIGIDWRDRRLIMNLYMNQKTNVKIQQEFSDESEIGHGLGDKVCRCCCSTFMLKQ